MLTRSWQETTEHRNRDVALADEEPSDRHTLDQAADQENGANPKGLIKSRPGRYIRRADDRARG